MGRVVTATSDSPRIEVRLSPTWGWQFRIDGHRCGYDCVSDCTYRGWRPFRAWAITTAMRRMRAKDRRDERRSQGWEPVDSGRSTDV